MMLGVEERVCLKKSVSKRSSIMLGEMVAIQMVLRFVSRKLTNTECQMCKEVNIFSDSQSAVGMLTLGWEVTAHKSTAVEVKGDITRLKLMEVEISLHWSPGHSDITGNEMADKLVKETAQQAKDLGEVSSITTLEDVKTATGAPGLKKWQDM